MHCILDTQERKYVYSMCYHNNMLIGRGKPLQSVVYADWLNATLPVSVLYSDWLKHNPCNLLCLLIGQTPHFQYVFCMLIGQTPHFQYVLCMLIGQTPHFQ